MKYFGLKDPNNNQILHTTAKFMGSPRKPVIGRREYFESNNVQSAIGKIFDICIESIVLSSNTVGAKVKLSSEQLDIYDKPEELHHMNGATCVEKGYAAHITVARADGVNAVQTNFDILKVHDLELQEDMITSKMSMGTLSCYKDNYFQLHLNKPLIFKSIFSGFY